MAKEMVKISRLLTDLTGSSKKENKVFTPLNLGKMEKLLSIK
jgi:hypothetical protein